MLRLNVIRPVVFDMGIDIISETIHVSLLYVCMIETSLLFPFTVTDLPTLNIKHNLFTLRIKMK